MSCASCATDFPELPVIILTAHDSLENAIESIKLGAFHFIQKPYVPEELMSLVKRALEQRQLSAKRPACATEKQILTRKLEKAERQLAPVAKSRSMQEIQELINRASRRPRRMCCCSARAASARK